MRLHVAHVQLALPHGIIQTLKWASVAGRVLGTQLDRIRECVRAAAEKKSESGSFAELEL